MNNSTLLTTVKNTVLTTLVSALFVLGSSSVQGQDITPFDEFNQRQTNISKNGMIALGAWGIGNMVAGGIGVATTPFGTEANYFHQMNIYWNAINVAIAVPGFIRAKKIKNRSLGVAETFSEQRKHETVYMINSGVDLGYIGLGLFMQQLGSKQSNKAGPLLQGFGNSIILQGGFLLVFDIIMVASYKRNWNKSRSKLWDQLQFGGNSIKLTF